MSDEMFVKAMSILAETSVLDVPAEIGWRLLDKAELVEAGDQFLDPNTSTWKESMNWWSACRLQAAGVTYRRPVRALLES
jgi:hypothetical protein